MYCYQKLFIKKKKNYIYINAFPNIITATIFLNSHLK